MKFHTRCRTCRSRRKLARHPEEYRIQPKCLCGSRSWRVDRYRQTGKDKRPICRSDCCPYVHRLGSNNLMPRWGVVDIEDGGSAFPEPGSAQCGGMSLRDYFAAKVYAATISGGYWPIDTSREEQADMAYKHADAMIAARNKESSQ